MIIFTGSILCLVTRFVTIVVFYCCNSRLPVVVFGITWNRCESELLTKLQSLGQERGTTKGGSSLHQAPGWPQTGRLRRTSEASEVKWTGLVWSALDAGAYVSQWQKVWLIKVSSTDCLASWITPRSRIRIVGKRNLFDFDTIFSWTTAQSYTGKIFKKQIDFFEIMTKKFLLFPKTWDLPH